MEKSPPDILWIDNDPSSMPALRYVLEIERGYNLTPATTVMRALQYLGNESALPKCILLDAALPVGGQAATKHFRQMQDHQSGDYSHITGHTIFEQVVFPDLLYERTIILSLLEKSKLQEAGFPENLPYYHKPDLYEISQYNKIIDQISALIGGQ